jgi:hypothetical protein
VLFCVFFCSSHHYQGDLEALLWLAAGAVKTEAAWVATGPHWVQQFLERSLRPPGSESSCAVLLQVRTAEEEDLVVLEQLLGLAPCPPVGLVALLKEALDVRGLDVEKRLAGVQVRRMTVFMLLGC